MERDGRPWSRGKAAQGGLWSPSFPTHIRAPRLWTYAELAAAAWAECVATAEVTNMHGLLLAAFGQKDERPFRPHVTLARLQGDGRATADEHPFNHTLSFTQRVEAVELFKSPATGEKGYEAVVSVPLERASA